MLHQRLDHDLTLLGLAEDALDLGLERAHLLLVLAVHLAHDALRFVEELLIEEMKRRVELKKVIGKYSEQAKVAIRNIRRDGMEQIKKLEKSGEISQDEQKKLASDIQLITDNNIKEIESAQEKKSDEVMQV